MTPISRTSLAVTVVAAAGLAGFQAARDEVPVLAANPTSPIQDSDGDLLPDALEWVLMTQPQTVDSDQDGVDDFIEAVTHELPKNPPTTVWNLDHEMRALVAIHEDQNQVEHVVLHVIVRIANGTNYAAVTSLKPFLDVAQVRVPIDSLVASGMLNFDLRVDPVEGLLIVFSARIASVKELRAVMPCTIGLTGSIGQRNFETGALLVDVDGVPSAIMPVSDTRFVVQPLNRNFAAHTSGSGGFWSQSKVCELELIPIGAGGGSQVCQVGDADCTGQPSLQCAPSCQTQSGKVYIVPYGLGLLNGK